MTGTGTTTTGTLGEPPRGPIWPTAARSLPPRSRRNESPAALRDLRVNLLSGVVAALGVLVYLVLAVRTGLAARDAVVAIAAILLTQVLPGAVVWRAVRPRGGWLLEDAAAGFAIGSAMAVPVQIVAGLSHQRYLAIVLPVLVTVVLLAVPTTRRRVREARWDAVPWWFAPAVAVTSLAAIPQFLGYATDNRISYSATTVPHVDTYLHQALAAQLLTRGPVSWPTVAGEDLGYHWFTHAWLAQVTASSGVELDAVLTRIMPALMPMAVVLAVAITALRVSRRAWVGVLAAVLTMIGGRFNPASLRDFAFPLTPYSPTLALGAPMLLLLVTVLALRWRSEMLRGAWLLVPLLAVVSAGTKGSTAPLVVAGLGLALVAMVFWNRRLAVPVLLDLLVVGAGLVFAVIFVFHGSSAGLKLGATNAAKQTFLASVLTDLPAPELIRLAMVVALLGGLSRAALAFLLPFFRDTRVDPLSWVLIGSSIAGAAAVALFSHPGRSQGYFYATAIPLAALGSALGAERLVRGLGRRVAALVAAIGIAGGVAGYLVPQLVTGPCVPAPTPRSGRWCGSPWQSSSRRARGSRRCRHRRTRAAGAREDSVSRCSQRWLAPSSSPALPRPSQPSPPRRLHPRAPSPSAQGPPCPRPRSTSRATSVTTRPSMTSS